MNKTIQYVTYKRVSTAEQGRSGLGLEAQERDIALFLDTYSESPYKVIGAFTDIGSGANEDRPELQNAIKLAKVHKAILLVAKLDRLSRKVSQIATLMEDKKIQLKVACMPQADNFQLHLYAALAEQERDFISKRTIAALQSAKARGVKLGGLRDMTGKRNVAKKAKAQTEAKKLKTLVLPLRKQGKSLREIADALNAAKCKTSTGCEFKAPQVQRILERLGAAQ